MPTRKSTISVRLDELGKKQVEMAARISKRSAGAFLGDIGRERARQVLLDWAVQRHRQGEASFSELAAETGLAVEEIMQAMSEGEEDETLDAFLASCRAIAEISGNEDFLRTGQAAVETVRRSHRLRASRRSGLR